MSMFEKMIGKRLEKVYLTNDNEKIVFKFIDGTKSKFYTTGDCCSHSWIEHLELPDDVNGATILSVEDSDNVPAWDGHECKKKDEYENECGHDVLCVYHTIFRTDKGDIVLEYRNDSNGYYGGSLEEDLS